MIFVKKMEIVNNPNITFSWHPGVYHRTDSGWNMGCIGARGICSDNTCGNCDNCKKNDPSYKQITKEMPNPSELAFFIRVNKDDYQLVKEFLRQYDNHQNSNPYYTKVEYPTINKHNTTKIKPEYKERIDKLVELREKFRNDAHVKELYAQIKELRSQIKPINDELIKIGKDYNNQGNEILGDLKCSFQCDLQLHPDEDDYDYINTSIPFSEVVIYEDDYNVQFTIFSIKGSKFYDEFLDKYDLISPNWPDWYAKSYTQYVKV